MSNSSRQFKVEGLRKLVGEPLCELAPTVVAEIKARDGKPTFPVFLPSLNEVTFGFKPNGISTIAARTSHGKSAFMIQAALHLGKLGKNVGFATLEDKNNSVMERVISNIFKVNNRDLQMGKLNIPAETIEKKLEPYNIYFFDSYGFNLGELEEIYQCATYENGKPMEILFMDYIGRTDSFLDYAMISDFMRELDAWCKGRNIAVVMGAQMNRQGVGTVSNDKIKGSGAIEEVSELVLLLNYPHQLGEEKEWSEEDERELQEIERKHPGSNYRKLFNRTYFEISVTKGKSTGVGHLRPYSYFGEFYDFRERTCPNAMVYGKCDKCNFQPEGRF